MPIWAITITEILLTLVAIFGFGSLFLSGKWMLIRPLCACGVILILAIGWYSTLSPRSAYLPQIHEFSPMRYSQSVFAGSVDQTSSLDWTVRITLLLGMFLVAVDLSNDQFWHNAFFWGMSVSGLVFAMIGILQKLGFNDPYCQIEPARSTSRFSAFSYHGNAGAFLNLVIPAFYGLIRSRSGGPRSLFKDLVLQAGLVVCIAAAFINVSRAAQVVTIGLLVAMSIPLLRSGSPRSGRIQFLSKFAWGALLITILIVGAGSASFHRWHSVGQQLGGDSPRAVLYRICARMITHAGLFGYGPGTFKILLPLAPGIATLYPKWIVTWHVPGTETSIWSNAHNDYLQTIIEWGWVGATAWIVLVAGGLVRAVAVIRKTSQLSARGENAILHASIMAIGATGVHSMVDFPLQVLPLQMYFLIYLAIAWSATKSKSIATPDKKTLQSSSK